MNGLTKKKWNLKDDFKRRWQLYLMLLLPVTYVVVFSYLPMGGIMIAFREFSFRKGIFGGEFVGLKYFKQFLGSPDFLKLLKNTLFISIYSLLAGFPAPIIFALLLNMIDAVRFKKFVQNLTYAPHFISTVVMVGIIINVLGLNNGIVNNLLDTLGMERIHFMGKASLFRHIYVWSGIWQGTGYAAVLYIATLTNIDKNLVEASLLDGANRLQRLRVVEWPVLKPIVTIQVIMAVAGIMSVGGDKILLMQNSLNTPVSEVIATYVYKRGLVNTEYSFSTAVGLFNSLVNCCLLFTANQISKKIGENSLF